MKNFTVTSKHRGRLLIHAERQGRPACGAEADGALVVEELAHVSCENCALLTAVLFGDIRTTDRRN